MRTTKTFYEQTVINSIDFDGYDLQREQEMTDFENILSVYAIFIKEYGFMIDRVGERKAFQEWLQGLPNVLTVPYMNYDILKNAIEGGAFMGDDVDKQDKFLNEYWANLSNAFFTLKNNL